MTVADVPIGLVFIGAVDGLGLSTWYRPRLGLVSLDDPSKVVTASETVVTRVVREWYAVGEGPSLPLLTATEE